MNLYTKVISLKGYYFIKDYEKKKVNAVKQRGIREETVRKFFKNGDCSVNVLFLETEKEILLTKDSPRKDIVKYLGEKFAGDY